MKTLHNTLTSRRMFLKFLAGSPVFSGLGLSAGFIEKLWATAHQQAEPPAPAVPLAQNDAIIASIEDALNVFDFEAVAIKNLPPAHYGYIATGVDDDVTLRANREGFKKIQLRMRRLVDVSHIDMSMELFGTTWETPIALAPAGSQKAFHHEGEIAVANAARTRRHLQILSTVTTTSVEDVTAARAAPVWYQLYSTSSWDVARALAARAEATGCPVLVLTVDLLAGSNRETVERFKRMDYRVCSSCHDPERPRKGKPMFDGIDMTDVRFAAPELTWDFVRRLKDATRMKLVIKGIVTHEDARLCVEYGADGIIVSNHGGRAGESGRATIDCLPEVVEAVDGRIPVLVDSGFRRGTDIFKALALGARAICIGRPYLWGLAAFGQPGVESVLDILRAELKLVMKQTGTTSIEKINRSSLVML